LLELYGLSIDELASLISKGLKNPIRKEELLGHEIKVSYLKRIDRVFEKGLHYYLDPKVPEKVKEASIFFRKQKFNTELNIGARKVVNHFEDFKISLSAIAKLSDIAFQRSVDRFSVKASAQNVAKVVRPLLYPDFVSEKRDFLKALISKLAASNILVFEFVETWNKKDKANIDGFFLNPNVIVVKRNQMGMRREIFTLAHELGHYLLEVEEIEQFDYNQILDKNLSKVETWCNEFAYHFLAGECAQIVDALPVANANNDYLHQELQSISKQTHLSETALFTRLLYQGKISSGNYAKVRAEIDREIQARIAEEKKQRELDAQSGKKQGGSVPKAINSPLLISTIQTAFYEGIIDEAEFCRTLNIKPDDLGAFIQ
jgi:Zn-dependent peptidase ImmA (M78 family)